MNVYTRILLPTLGFLCANRNSQRTWRNIREDGLDASFFFGLCFPFLALMA